MEGSIFFVAEFSNTSCDLFVPPFLNFVCCLFYEIKRSVRGQVEKQVI